MSEQLCTQSSNFTFADPMQTCVALTNTYLFLGWLNPEYYNEFMQVSGVEYTKVLSFFYKDQESKFTGYFDELG